MTHTHMQPNPICSIELLQVCKAADGRPTLAREMRIVAQAYGPPKGGSARRSDSLNPSSQDSNTGRKASRQPSSRDTPDRNANFAATPRNLKPPVPGPSARKPTITPSERQGQSKSAGSSKASSSRAGAGSGYSAGDRPERRKNPELYAGLQVRAVEAHLTCNSICRGEEEEEGRGTCAG